MEEEWSVVFESQQFVVPSSQIDSQSDSTGFLPALKKNQLEKNISENSEIVYPVMDGAGPSGRILVADSEVESNEKGAVSSDGQVVEETAVEDKDDSDVVGGTSSDDTANVTVIAKRKGLQQEEDEQMSQDLFAARRDEDKKAVVTPSQTMPSLQLSGSGMLVPETMEESLGMDEEISPSPEAYGKMPMMIPSTPTASQSSVVEGQGEYTPGSASTLRSLQKDPKLFAIMDMAQSQDEVLASASQQEAVFAGQTLAGESMPEWQQSQSLHLHLTGTSGSTQQDSQPKSAAKASSQRLIGSVGDSAVFGGSQDLRLHLSQSQEAALASQQSGAFSLSVPKPGSAWTTPRGETSGKVLSQSTSTPSSDSRNYGTPAKPAMSLGMVQSESQSASETLFKLERPNVTALSGQQSGTDMQSRGEGESMNVFQRTRQGRKLPSAIGGAASHAHVLSEDSEDFFGDTKKTEQPTGVQSLSDSEPFPCSQKRMPQSSPKAKAAGAAKSEAMEVDDAYNVDTVMDSEPEEEGTQSYEVFPALSGRSATSTPTAQAEIKEETEPQMLPITVAVSPPLAQPHMSQSNIGALHVSQSSQPSSQMSRSQTRQLSQQMTSSPRAETSQSGGAAERLIGSPVGHVSQGSVHNGDGKSQSRLASNGSKGAGEVSPSVSQQAREETPRQGSQPQAQASTIHKPTLSPEFPGPPAENIAQSVMGKSSSQPAKGSSQPLAASAQSDPYLFHGSQSQLMEGEGLTTTARAETSLSTLHAAESKSKGASSLGRRRKCLVKKKPEPAGKGSSTSADETSKPATKPTRRAKRAPKQFTKLVAPVASEAPSSFKAPTNVPRRKSKDLETVQETPASVLPVRQPVVTLNPLSMTLQSNPAPVAGSAGERGGEEGAGGSQEGNRLMKRKSVEFSNTVQIGSPSHAHQISLEHSLSDTQSSDTLLEVTNVTEYVMRFVRRITKIQLINKDGQIIQEKTSREEEDPVVIEEREMRQKRYVPIPLSPSRSNSTVTSGDLGDISSSSLSNRGQSGPGSSLERGASSLELSQPPAMSSAFVGDASAGNVSAAAVSQISVGWQMPSSISASTSLLERGEGAGAGADRRSLAGRSSAGASPAALSFLSPMQSSIEKEDSRLDAVVTSSSSGRVSESLFSADNASAGGSEVPCAQPSGSAGKSGAAASLSSSSSLSSSGVVPPTDRGENGHRHKQKKQTSESAAGGTPASRSPRKSARRVAADSSQEEKQGSTKITSSPESQMFITGAESGGFSVGGLSGSRKKSSVSSMDSGERTLKQQVESTRARRRSATSGSSSDATETAAASTSKQEPLSDQGTSPVEVKTVSTLDIGSRVLCRWKDGFFYPATFIGLNTGIGNKFKVVFEDGFEKVVRAVDLVMAQNIPTGQSVLVVGEDGASDPGIVVEHITDWPQFKESGEVMYEVDMDNGTKKRCQRLDLLLTEDQASLLLSEEEYRATFGEGDAANTADVSLDNVILGKRLRIKGTAAVGVPRRGKASTSAAPSDDEDDDDDGDDSPRHTTKSKAHVESESPASRNPSGKETVSLKSSARKRKMGPVATSTPTPKIMRTSEGHQTPKKALRESFSPLGAAVESPENQKRSARKARIGLFDSAKGPVPTAPGLFTGYVFVLTHVIKAPATLAEEKRQLHTASVDSSTELSTDDEGATAGAPFDKDHLKAQIIAGGGTVLKTLDSAKISMHKKSLYCISDTHQRTVKYFMCLAANVPIVSHVWIRDSCVQNKLQDYKSYTLPAGISLEKHKIMERNFSLSCLQGWRIMLSSAKSDYVEVWSSILELCGCKLKSTFAATKNRPGVDVVVADHTCPKSLLNKAEKNGVPVVASEWVIQCLFNSEIMDYKGHPKYAYDYYKEVASVAESGSTPE